MWLWIPSWFKKACHVHLRKGQECVCALKQEMNGWMSLSLSSSLDKTGCPWMGQSRWKLDSEWIHTFTNFYSIRFWYPSDLAAIPFLKGSRLPNFQQIPKLAGALVFAFKVMPDVCKYAMDVLKSQNISRTRKKNCSWMTWCSIWPASV